MNRKIPKEFIYEILSKTNIIDLIGSYIELKKKGKNYYAKCPFHNEKIPSFVVNYEKQFFHCFGCQLHGNSIDFLMKYNNLNFLETIKELSKLNNLEYPKKKKNNQELQKFNYKNNLFTLMKFAKKIYNKNIFKKNSKYAYKYLKNRGINKKMIEFFSIGFSNFKSNIKLLNIIKKKSFKKIDINDTGLFYKKKNNVISSKFINRIIFPIRDIYGRTTGFGARIINDSNCPKYINSQETKIFYKSQQIYGLYEQKKIFKLLKYLILVEGYIDVITLTQFHIKYCVGLLGTTLNNEHLKILFKNTNTLIYCYDGDTAGKKAMWNSFVLSLPHIYDNRTIKFILLPKGEDPDSIIRKEGLHLFKKRILNALSIDDFLFESISKKKKIKKIEEKTFFLKKSIHLIKKIPGKLVKLFFLKKLGKKVGISDFYELKKIFNNKKKITYKLKKNKKSCQKNIKIKILISLIIQNPNLAKKIIKFKKIKKINSKESKIFINILKNCLNIKNVNTAKILEVYRNKKIFSTLQNLSSWNNMISKKKIKIIFLEIIKKLYLESLERKQEKIILKSKKKKLTKKEKKIFWKINKYITKKKFN
ncbi:DNA primase [Buchnera aphidicola]|uniref:DNA primase n=1 Tax=Buchnera aphidicola TaxID=9 RepID=UPI0030EF3726